MTLFNHLRTPTQGKSHEIFPLVVVLYLYLIYESHEFNRNHFTAEDKEVPSYLLFNKMVLISTQYNIV